MENVFSWEPSNLGGTEVAIKWFHKNVLPHMKNIQDYRCIAVPGAPQDVESLYDGQRNILWLHLTPDQIDDGGMNLIKTDRLIDTVDYFITLSNFHKAQTVRQLGISPERVFVIEYPLDKIPSNPQKFDNVDKVKIIHASQASRGLEVLLRSLEYIDKYDYELNVYNDFYPEQSPSLALEELLESNPRITFYGKTPRRTVLSAFADSHIHAYPSIFEETACLTQMESLASGNLSVYSNIGVLPETSRGHGLMVDFYQNGDVIERYGLALADAIDRVQSGNFDPTEQINDIVSYRSEDRIIQQWLDFDKMLSMAKE